MGSVSSSTQWERLIEEGYQRLNTNPSTPEELQQLKQFFTSKPNGLFARIQQILREAPPEEKRVIGKALNALRTAYQERWQAWKTVITQHAEVQAFPDPTLPGVWTTLPGLTPCPSHPLTATLNQICTIFMRLGFWIAEGPEIETDWYNFTALNIPEDHPAREMQDTFYIRVDDPPVLLRTHTSPVQIRVMEKMRPPIRIIAPGRVYRNETVSARAHVQFHQVEGLYVDRHVTIADLKSTLNAFARQFFGPATRTRFRISYFPFTEPSFEMDVSCTLCDGKGCAVCKRTGWVEILGCGMVDPAVLENCQIDPEQYSGFAFGMGVERLTMLSYRIEDIRRLFQAEWHWRVQPPVHVPVSPAGFHQKMRPEEEKPTEADKKE